MLTATGNLMVTDVDTGQNQAQPQTNTPGIYGTFAVTAGVPPPPPPHEVLASSSRAQTTTWPDRNVRDIRISPP